MKIREDVLINEIILDGIDSGYAKAFKHTDTPEPNLIKEQLSHYILLQICEYYNFNDEKFKEYSIFAQAVDSGIIDGWDNFYTDHETITDVEIFKKYIFEGVRKSIDKYFVIEFSGEIECQTIKCIH